MRQTTLHILEMLDLFLQRLEHSWCQENFGRNKQKKSAPMESMESNMHEPGPNLIQVLEISGAQVESPWASGCSIAAWSSELRLLQHCKRVTPTSTTATGCSWVSLSYACQTNLGHLFASPSSLGNNTTTHNKSVNVCIIWYDMIWNDMIWYDMILYCVALYCIILYYINLYHHCY